MQIEQGWQPSEIERLVDIENATASRLIFTSTTSPAPRYLRSSLLLIRITLTEELCDCFPTGRARVRERAAPGFLTKG